MIPVLMAAVGGLIYGSFLNMLLWRLPEGKSIGGRSLCRSCSHILAWYDLIPVLSFLVLRGQCRYCKDPIHLRYPIVEMVTAMVLGAYFYIRTPVLGLEAIITISGLLVLTSLFFFDLFYFILPDVIVFPAIGAYVCYDLLIFANPWPFFLTAFLGAGFFAILYAVSGGKKLGFGDVKLAFLLGLMFGYPLGFLIIVLGIWLAALVSIGLLILGKASRKSMLPLGSFLALAALLAIIYHHEFIPFLSFFS